MSRAPNHFKIGVFVLTAVGLAVLGIVALGSGRFFNKKIMAETYVDESVQGIDVGSPVKHRGVQIGRVERITFVRSKYLMSPDNPEYFQFGRYVLIEFSLNEDAFEAAKGRNLTEVMRELVESGLRVQLVPTSLATGIMYLEADYVKDGAAPPLRISWEPQYIYIPSRPSTISSITAKAGNIVERIQSLDVEGVVNKTETLMENLNKTVIDAEIGDFSKQGRELFDSLKESNARLQKLLEEKKLDAIVEDSRGAVGSVRRSAESFEKSLPEIMENLKTVSADLREISANVNKMLGEGSGQKLMESLSGLAEDLRSTSKGLPEMSTGANRALHDVDRLIQDQSRRIDVILRNVESATENIRDMTRDARQNPSNLILGGPPQRIDPSR